MKTIFTLLFLGLILSARSLGADPAGDARKAIAADYAAIDAATERRDAAGATAFYAPDYTATDAHGRTLTADEERRTAQEVLALGHDVTSKTTVLTFVLDAPDQATAGTRSRLTMTLPDPKTKAPQKVALDGTGRDVWVKTPQGWRERSSRILTTAMTVNGKPAPTQ